MKKNVYKLDNIHCAACGLDIESVVQKLLGVEDASMNVITMKLFVTFDETQVTDEEIEQKIHTSLNGVKIVEKNNQFFEDTYVEEKGNNIFARILLNRRKK